MRERRVRACVRARGQLKWAWAEPSLTFALCLLGQETGGIISSAHPFVLGSRTTWLNTGTTSSAQCTTELCRARRQWSEKEEVCGMNGTGKTRCLTSLAARPTKSWTLCCRLRGLAPTSEWVALLLLRMSCFAVRAHTRTCMHVHVSVCACALFFAGLACACGGACPPPPALLL